jgi:hypothetical protein
LPCRAFSLYVRPRMPTACLYSRTVESRPHPPFPHSLRHPRQRVERLMRKTLWKSDTTRTISFGFQSAFTYRHRPQLGYHRRRPYYRAATLYCKLYYYYGRLQLASLKFLGLVIASSIALSYLICVYMPCVGPWITPYPARRRPVDP